MKSDLNNPKIISLIRDWGMEGYGFFKLIENHLKPKKINKSLSTDSITDIAETYGITSYKALRITKYYNLFDIDGDVVRLKQDKEQ